MLTQPICCTTQSDKLCICRGGEFICPPKVGIVTKWTYLHFFLSWLKKEDKSLVFDSLNMQSICFFPKPWQKVEHLALIVTLIETAWGCSELACKNRWFLLYRHTNAQEDVCYHLFHWPGEISERGEAESRSEGGVAGDDVLITLRQPAETDL